MKKTKEVKKVKNNAFDYPEKLSNRKKPVYSSQYKKIDYLLGIPNIETN